MGFPAGRGAPVLEAEKSIARGAGTGALSEDERAELVRLHKENAELQMQHDVLKRSVAPLG